MGQAVKGDAIRSEGAFDALGDCGGRYSGLVTAGNSVAGSGAILRALPELSVVMNGKQS